ncbi:hypothetical protein LLB_1418 [Legionella longbeachae D-4968]|nr:hypothetical protein LLB_1418 [Legionella longbeachae D-4968]
MLSFWLRFIYMAKRTLLHQACPQEKSGIWDPYIEFPLYNIN